MNDGLKVRKVSYMGISAISLFCGAGGLAYGLRRAGIDVKLGVDIEERCAWPFRHNVDADFLKADIAQLSPSDLPRRTRRDGFLVITGCAPCQPFSYANRYRARDAAHGVGLLGHFLSLALQMRPEFVFLENVSPVLHQSGFKKIRNELAEGGYQVWAGTVDAYDCGVAQTRRRAVVLATRLRIAPGGIRKSPGPRPRTLRDAIGGLPQLKAGGRDSNDPLHAAAGLSALNLRRIKASQPGGTWADWPSSLRLDCHRDGPGAGYTESYGRMRWDRAAPTITTKFFNYGSGRFGHPDQDRALSPREAALLQGFPTRFRFAAHEEDLSFGDIGRLIGNAVPVPLGFAVGRTIHHLVQMAGTA